MIFLPNINKTFSIFKSKLEQSKPGQLEIPKLRKVAKEPVSEPEKKKDDGKDAKDKKVVKKVVKKKKESEYELPDIPDYERPVLEKYEKVDIALSERVSENTAETTHAL